MRVARLALVAASLVLAAIPAAAEAAPPREVGGIADLAPTATVQHGAPQAMAENQGSQKQYSLDPTIRAGEIAREQSFTETTEAEQIQATDGGDAQRSQEQQPRAYSDVHPLTGESVDGTAAATASTSTSTSDTASLEDMTVADLKAEAERRGVTVTRGDGEDGAPLKADYVKALGG